MAHTPRSMTLAQNLDQKCVECLGEKNAQFITALLEEKLYRLRRQSDYELFLIEDYKRDLGLTKAAIRECKAALAMMAGCVNVVAE